MSTLDQALAPVGYKRVDCRNCKTRFVVSAAEWKEFLKESTAARDELARPAPVRKPPEPIRAAPVSNGTEGTVIGRGVLIHGDLFTRECLYVYGEVRGSVDARGCDIVIQPGGSVAATVTSNRITVCREGRFTGEATANSVIIEDGAYIAGKVETIGREKVNEGVSAV